MTEPPQKVAAGLRISWAIVPRGTPSPDGLLGDDHVLISFSTGSSEHAFLIPKPSARDLSDGLAKISSEVLVAPSGLAAQLAAQAAVRFGEKK